jgi:hypothetical protein
MNGLSGLCDNDGQRSIIVNSVETSGRRPKLPGVNLIKLLFLLLPKIKPEFLSFGQSNNRNLPEWMQPYRQASGACTLKH